jgi:integrase
VRFTTPDGRRIDRTTGRTHKGAAAKEAADIYAQTLAGRERKVVQRPSRAQGELEDLIARWLAWAEDRVSPEWLATLEIYAQAHWLPRWARLSQLTEPAIERYIAERLREVTSTTVGKELSGLRSLLKWCAKVAGVLSRVPTWERPKPKSDYEPVELTREQVLALLEKLPTQRAHPKGHPVREYYTVMWGTAWRLGTMSRVTWEDLDLTAGEALVRAAADKKRNRRAVPLTPEAVQALKAWRKALGDAAVGRVFGPRRYTESLKQAAKEIGLSADVASRVGNHTLRHARLTDLASRSKNIAAIQYFAGHRDLHSTMRYVHGALEATREMLTDVDSGGHSGGRSAGFSC